MGLSVLDRTDSFWFLYLLTRKRRISGVFVFHNSQNFRLRRSNIRNMGVGRFLIQKFIIYFLWPKTRNSRFYGNTRKFGLFKFFGWMAHFKILKNMKLPKNCYKKIETGELLEQIRYILSQAVLTVTEPLRDRSPNKLLNEHS